MKFFESKPTPIITIEEMERKLDEKQKKLIKLYEDGRVKNQTVSMEAADLRMEIKKIDRELLEAYAKREQTSKVETLRTEMLKLVAKQEQLQIRAEEESATGKRAEAEESKHEVIELGREIEKIRNEIILESDE